MHIVVSRQGNNYTIRDVIAGKETVAHVSQIARMRSPVGPEESEEVPALTQNDEQVWVQVFFSLIFPLRFFHFS